MTIASTDRNSSLERFRRTIEAQIPEFLTKMQLTLQDEFDIDVSSLQADHVCWRTESLQEYSQLTSDLQKNNQDFELLIESEIGGRPIATFSLKWPMSSAHHSIHVLEIPSPKTSSPYPAGLEHVEFVIGDGSCIDPWNNDNHRATLADFQQKHPKAPWNTKAAIKGVNPDISIKLQLEKFGFCSAKFHLMPLKKVIEAEKRAIPATGVGHSP